VVRETAERAVLGIVGNSYTPLQNEEAFGFFDPIVGKDAAIYHTAGALGQGEKVWILAKMPDSIRVVGDDLSEKYLLLSNSHDGKLCLQIKFTPVRVVCQNTLTLALQGGADVKLKHHQDIRERLKEAETALGLIRREYDEIAEAFRELAQIQVNEGRLKEYLGRVYPMAEDVEDLEKQRIERDRMWSGRLFDQGQGNRMKGVSGTLWAAFNGVTEWIDHRKVRQNRDQRLNSLWFGEGCRIKARAFEVAQDLAEVWRN
jgi:phage/plasmid-like protein (TIGR03299 family)